MVLFSMAILLVTPF